MANVEMHSAALHRRKIRPMSSYPGVNKIPPADYSFEGSLASLHEIAWGKQNKNVLFRDDDVHRDGTCTQPDISNSVPHTVSTLRWGEAVPDVLTSYGISSIFVRDEYLSMLQDILRKGGAAFTTELPVPDFPRGGALHGAVICGSPGIGKSILLVFILSLRVLFGLPTIFQSRAGIFFAVNADGVFSAKLEENVSLDAYIPDYTWLLVDSNQGVRTVSDEYIALSQGIGCFILQAASPRTDRLEWTKKVGGRVSVFWMAPWSSVELIAARNLQRRKPEVTVPSESQLLIFAQKFGTSPRHAYSHAANLDEYEKTLVNRNVAKLDSETIRTMLKKADGVEMDSDISHLLLAVYPAPDDRLDFHLDIWTDYLVDRIVGRLEVADQLASLHLYWLFLTNSHTRSAVGQLLERAFKTRFRRGGEWPITKMKRYVTHDKIRWHFNSSATRQYLRSGYGRYSISIADRSLRNPQDALTALEDTPYTRGASITLASRRFYRPIPKNFPSYDAFIYDAKKKRATVFQVTIAKDHEIVHEGLDWLRDRGVLSIDLVVVTCPTNLDRECFGNEKIWTRNDDVERINDVYHLPLHDE